MQTLLRKTCWLAQCWTFYAWPSPRAQAAEIHSPTVPAPQEQLYTPASELGAAICCGNAQHYPEVICVCQVTGFSSCCHDLVNKEEPQPPPGAKPPAPNQWVLDLRTAAEAML